MKLLSLLKACAFACLASATLEMKAQDPNFHIYLCFGQSNMEGYPGIPDQYKKFDDARFQVLAAVNFPEQGRIKGQWYKAEPPLSRPQAGLSPADFFGRAMVAKLPTEIRVGVVNVAVGGARIEVFDTNTVKEYAKTAPDWMKRTLVHYDNDPYQRLVEMGRQAQKDGVIKGILLHQGESNVNDREWPQKVKATYNRLLADLGLKAENVPLLAGEVVGADQKGKAAGMNEIIALLPQTVPTAHIIPSQGCEGLPDQLHFSPAGYEELGKRYAAKALELMAAGSKLP